MDAAIISYYDKLAPSYDLERFGNSYGRFIEVQERAILARFLPEGVKLVLDLGCGTGRLSDRASHGCDASLASLGVAAARHVSKVFVAADLAALPYRTAAFDAAYCFHVYMHLAPDVIRASFFEAARVLRPGGVFVADVASARRRAIVGYRPKGWHGGTSLRRSEFKAMAAQAGFRMVDCVGVMLAPIHRAPAALRSSLAAIDCWAAARSPEFASYMVGLFRREPIA